MSNAIGTNHNGYTKLPLGSIPGIPHGSWPRPAHVALKIPGFAWVAADPLSAAWTRECPACLVLEPLKVIGEKNIPFLWVNMNIFERIS